MYVLFYMAFRIIISQERVNSLSSNNYFAISMDLGCMDLQHRENLRLLK